MIVTSGLPADSVEGEIEEIDGVAMEVMDVDDTRKGTELDVTTRVPSRVLVRE